MNKKAIIERAKAVCREHDVNEYPIQLVELCENCGLKVYQERLPAEVSGFIVVQDKPFNKYDTGRLIVVNRNEPQGRKRFTIAHELGHYFLHRDENETLYAHRDAGQSGKIETEANIFATNILMPEDLVREAINNRQYLEGYSLMDETKISLISYEFLVSRPAAEVRLRELHLL